MAGKSWDIEVFSTGVWNEEEFTVEDLNKMAVNFKLLQGVHKPPLKLGHDDNQKFMDQTDGGPALGWVSNLKVSGEKLIATVSDVPDKVWELIKAGRYKRQSAEIYEDVTYKGNAIGPVLRAVALLGADIPAVTNLEEIHAFLMAEKNADFRAKQFSAFTSKNPTHKADPMPDKIEGVSAADFKAFQERMENALKEKDAEIQKYHEKEKAKDAEAKVRKFVESKNGVLAKANELVKAGKLTPKSRDDLEVMFGLQERDFSEEKGLQVKADWVLALFSEIAPAKKDMGKKVESREAGYFKENPLHKGVAGEDTPDYNGLSPEDEAVARAQKLAGERKISLAEAQKRVFTEDPILMKNVVLQREREAAVAKGVAQGGE